jgi:hypothetical protein
MFFSSGGCKHHKHATSLKQTVSRAGKQVCKIDKTGRDLTINVGD